MSIFIEKIEFSAKSGGQVESRSQRPYDNKRGTNRYVTDPLNDRKVCSPVKSEVNVMYETTEKLTEAA